jgi:hypothetical protein
VLKPLKCAKTAKSAGDWQERRRSRRRSRRTRSRRKRSRRKRERMTKEKRTMMTPRVKSAISIKETELIPSAMIV